MKTQTTILSFFFFFVPFFFFNYIKYNNIKILIKISYKTYDKFNYTYKSCLSCTIIYKFSLETNIL